MKKKERIYIQKNLITPLRNDSARALKNRNSIHVKFQVSGHALAENFI